MRPAETDRQGDALGAAVTLRAVTCPQCAGSVQARPGSRILLCTHCGSRFLQSHTGEYERRHFPARVPRLRAVGLAQKWLLGYASAPDDITDSAFTSAQLVYVPIWEVRAHVVGWEFGKKRRTKREVLRVGDQEIVDVKLVDEDVESGFLDERRMYREAVDLRPLGMGRPHITGRDFTLPFVPGALEEGSAVLEVQTDHSAVLEDARRSFLRPPTGTLSRETRLHLMRERVALLYYPLWQLRYRYEDRSYEVVVDGRNGEIHAARAPADNSRMLLEMVASFAGLAVAAGLLFVAWSDWGLPPTVAFYGALLVLLLVGTVFWRFEPVREVQYHEPFSA